MAVMSDVTQILAAVEAGDRQAAAELLPLVYDELRKLAAARMAAEASGQTLQPTALVHEAYLRLVGKDAGQPWNSRGHFFAAAAEAMRRILVDAARRRAAVRHGGGQRRVPLEDIHRVTETPEGLIDLDDALTRFAAVEPRKARLVELRFFAGCRSPRRRRCSGCPRPPPPAGGSSPGCGCSPNSGAPNNSECVRVPARFSRIEG